jgi:hypothetical protein
MEKTSKQNLDVDLECPIPPIGYAPAVVEEQKYRKRWSTS